MPDAYIFQADLMCAPCAAQVRESLKTAGGWTFDPDAETWTHPCGQTFDAEGALLAGNGFRGGGTDTDTFPAGPYPDGGGEADSPQHCGSCHIFLENPLTADGNAYAVGCILEAFEGKSLPCAPHATVAVREWLPFYRDGFTRHQKAAIHLAMAAFDQPPSSRRDLDLWPAVEEAVTLLLWEA